MAVTDFLEGMNDYRLRPRMLRSLVRDRLPDEKRPLPSPADLSSILAYVKTHGLLSESLADSSDGKLIEAWRSAVDAWVDRVLFLVSSNMVAVQLFSDFLFSKSQGSWEKFSKCGFFEHIVEVLQLVYNGNYGRT